MKKTPAKSGKDAAVVRAVDLPTAGVSIAADGGTALHVAAKKRRFTAVRVLIEALHDKARGPDERLNLDARDMYEKTPLIYAASVNHVGIVKELLAAKANPGLRDSRGRTAFMYAAQIGGEQVCKGLNAADPTLQNATDRNGDDPPGLLLKYSKPGMYAPPDAVNVALLLREHTNPGFLTIGVRARDVEGVRRPLDSSSRMAYEIKLK